MQVFARRYLECIHAPFTEKTCEFKGIFFSSSNIAFFTYYNEIVSG